MICVVYLFTMTDDQQTIADSADEEIADGKSVLGHAPEESPDVDDTLESVGLPGDKDGPRELNSEAVIAAADQQQE